MVELTRLVIDPPVDGGAPIRLRVGDAVLPRTGASIALPVATSDRPRLSWVVPLERHGQAQAAYRIVAAAHGDPRVSTGLWDSGMVDSAENYGVVWGGEPLVAGTTVQWAVRVMDERGEASPWSEVVEFVVPPLTAADWTGEWIVVPPTMAVRTTFEVEAVPTRAILHFAGQGLMRAVIDGEPVNGDARDPSDTARTRAVSRSYDVTERLRGSGEHVLGFVGALGHHREVLDAPRLLAELVITFDDGSTQTIATSDHWTLSATSLTGEDPFYAETHDTRIGDEWGRSTAGAGDRRARRVSAGAFVRPLPGTITPDAGPPVRVVEERMPALLSSPAAGIHVFDVGDNVAARSRIRLTGTRSGQRISVVHGELLDDTGRVDTRNLRLPWDRDRERQVIEWICSGGDETIQPWFAIHGFRYLEISGSGDARIDSVVARIIHSDVGRTGSFASSDPLLDRLVAQAVRTQLNNTHAHPEDCPTREQGGWTGDASVSAEAALSHLDIAAVYRNWLIDVAEDQRSDGGILGVSPLVMSDAAVQPADPVWGSAMTEIPWQLWRHTGDIDALAALFPAMRRWCDWQLATLDGGVVRHADISYGADWLAPRQTPPVLLQTAAVARSLSSLAHLEDAAGQAEQATKRREQAQRVTETARRELWDPDDAVWGNGSQASYAVALSSGLVAGAERATVEARLVAAIEREDGRVSSGYAGTQSVVRALADIDDGVHLQRLIHDPTQPGVGAMLVDGPGTFWETWWIEEPRLGIASLDHIGLAAPFAAWAWTGVAGIRPTAAGYREFTVDLRSRLVDAVDVRMMTVRGEVAVRRRSDGDRIEAVITVPVGAEAVVLTDAIELEVAGEAVGDGESLRLGPGSHRVTGRRPALSPIRISAAPPPDRESLWLSGARDITGWNVDHGSSVRRIDERWVCAPVFHEPVDGGILEVIHHDLAVDDERWATLRFDTPVDLTAARFVFAHLDLDDPVLPGRRVIPTLRVRAADGAEATGTTRVLPVAWNRIAIDVGEWPGLPVVSEIAVGIRWSAEHDIARGPDAAPPIDPVDLRMMISRVGHSAAKRTW